MSILESQDDLIMDNNNTSDESSSSSDESSTSTIDDTSSSDEDDSIFLGDVNELTAELESRIHPQFREIAAAIRKDDEFSLSVALDNFNGNIDQHLIYGETALHYACKEYSTSCFKLLLQRGGANIEAKNIAETIPLNTACGLGLYKIVKIILDYTTNLDIITRMVRSVNIYGETPLHNAVVGRNINVIKLLFNAGATNIGINKMLESRDAYGETPLHTSAKYGNSKVVKLLLEFGASTKTKNSNGKIPWELAKPNSGIRRLLEEADED